MDCNNNKILVYACIAALFLGIIIVGALALFSNLSEGFSELYFENPDGLQKIVNIGDKVRFEFTVVSHERAISHYVYNVSYDGQIIESGSFSLIPEIKENRTNLNINKKTIEVSLVPNTSSLIKIGTPVVNSSKMRYNAVLAMVPSQGQKYGDKSMSIAPNGYSVTFWGENNVTLQLDVQLTNKKILPIELQTGTLSPQKGLLIFDPAKKESYVTASTVLIPLGNYSNPNPTNTNLLSDLGYILRKEKLSIDNDHGTLDMLRQVLETKYLYKFKKISVEVTSSDIQFRSSATTVTSNEKPIKSNYEIHFWIIVKERPDKLASL